MMRTGAVILAGGQGRRMNSRVPKQYLPLGGRPLITFSLEAFDNSDADELVLVVPAGEENRVGKELLAPLALKKPVRIVRGGRERCHSSWAGIQALSGCDCVLVHDGARPLITAEVIARVIADARKYGACAAAVPVKDTIRIADEEGFSVATPDRAGLWQIQTPQGFSYPLIAGAYKKLMDEPALQAGVTDDAMVAERCLGFRVKLTPGDYENLKVTTPGDLIQAEALLARRGR